MQKIKKLTIEFERFDALDSFVKNESLRVFTKNKNLAEAFGITPLDGDDAEVNALLFDEVLKGGFVFPVRMIEGEGEVELLDEDEPDSDIIGYLVMTLKGLQVEGLESTREAAFDWIEKFVWEDLVSYLNGHTIQCSVAFNGQDEWYTRGPFFSLEVAFEEIAAEFGSDVIV